MTIRQLINLASVAVLGIALASNAQASADNLVEVKNAEFQQVWIDPSIDYSRFDNVVLGHTEFDYRDVGKAKRSRAQPMNNHDKYFGLSAADRERFETDTGKAFEKRLRYGNYFSVSDEVSASSLVIVAQVSDIASTAPPPYVGRGHNFANSVGEATVVIQLIDASSGEVVAMIAERGPIQAMRGQGVDSMFEVTTASAWAEVRLWAGRYGTRLAAGLDKLVRS